MIQIIDIFVLKIYKFRSKQDLREKFRNIVNI